MKNQVLRTVERQLRQYDALKKKKDANSRAWCAAIRAALGEYEQKGEPAKVRLVSVRYFERQTEEKTMERVHISRNTYYAWKKDILDTIAFYAAQSGLFTGKP